MSGKQAVYRSLFGGAFPARIVSEREDGLVDLDVAAVGGDATVRLSRIVVAPDENACGDGECYRTA